MNQWRVIKLKHKVYSCEVLADYGAALNSYRFREKEFVEGYTNPSEVKEQKYKGVILAPFPNRIAKAKYTFEEDEFTLAINREKEGLALHGLLYNEPFEVIHQSQREVKLSYTYEGSKKGYPFLFSLNITYKLKDDGRLWVRSEVENQGGRMPFGLGWHPYFKMNSSIDTCVLEMPSTKKLSLDKALIPSGEQVFFSQKKDRLKLSEHHFDDCFALLPEERATFKLIGSDYELEVKGTNPEDFPYFQIYTPKNRSSIAIEPMTCAPNAFNNQMGLIILAPDEKRSFTYEIKANCLD